MPFDLHVLGAPPAFILSQDRTLRPKGDVRHPPVSDARRPSGQLLADRIHSIEKSLLVRK